MADSNGKVNDFNKISVKQREYYYDREETDKDIQKDFGDMMSGIKATAAKFKKEASVGQPAKLDITKDSLGLKEEWNYSSTSKVMSKNIGGQMLKFEISEIGEDKYKLRVSNKSGDVSYEKVMMFDDLVKKLNSYGIQLK